MYATDCACSRGLGDYGNPTDAFTGGGSTSGGSRRGGDDPCCPPGYNPSGVWPRNSGVLGAPPDYRTRGAPMEDASPNGGRLKDDFCDCIPIQVGGRWWKLAAVDGGRVYLGPLVGDLDGAVWAEVTGDGATVLGVPGYNIEAPPPPPEGSGGEGPTYGGGGTGDDGGPGPGQCPEGSAWVPALGLCVPGPTDGDGGEGSGAGAGGGSVPTRTDPVVNTEAGFGVVGWALGFILAAALSGGRD